MLKLPYKIVLYTYFYSYWIN